MTWLEDIGTYLQTAGIGTLGTSIFYSGFDASAINCISLIAQAGYSEKYTNSKTKLRRPELGVRVRNSSDSAAFQKAQDIYTALDLVTNQTIGSTWVKKIKSIADPFFVSTDSNNYYIYSINFSLEIE